MSQKRQLFDNITLFKHRPREGRWIAGGAEDPRPVRSHLFRRPTQGGNAGGMSAGRFTGGAFGFYIINTPRRGR